MKSETSQNETEISSNLLAYYAGYTSSIDEESEGSSPSARATEPENLEINLTSPPPIPLDPDETEVDRWSFGDKSRTLRLLGITAIAGGFGAWMTASFLAPAPPSSSVQEQETKEESATKNPEPVASPDPEVGKIKTKLAVQTQERMLKESQGKSGSTPTQTRPTPTQKRPTQSTQTREGGERITVRQLPPPSSPPPKREYRTTSTPVVPLPRERTFVRSVNPPAPPPVSVAIEPTPSIPPGQAWQQAARLGSFGDGVVKQPSVQPQGEDVVGENPLATDNPGYPEEQAVLADVPPINLKVPGGVRGRGVLETAITWEGQQQIANELHLIRLVEPITDRQGQEILPVDTLILVAVVPSGSALVRLLPKFLMLPNREEQISLPESSFTFRRHDGAPLIAQRRDNSPGRGINVPNLLFDGASTFLPFITGSSGNPYQNYYQVENFRRFYERNFNTAQGNPQGQLPTVPTWELPGGMELQIAVSRSFVLGISQQEVGDE